MASKKEYQVICEKLGFRPETGYVEVTRAGGIQPSAGTRSEAIDLWRAVASKGFRPSVKFQKLAKREGF